jgi:ornithine cyclodeaminase/alanine dehydrogenase-like protein (mu-crystallin family)
MVLILREADVRGLVTVGECVDWLEESFRAHAANRARNLPRARVRYPEGMLHVLPAGDFAAGAVGLKAYTSGRGGTRMLVVLFSSANGELLALLEANYLGAVRTGATSGLATKYLARQDARRVGIFGTGRQARTQLAAVAAVRELESATAWSRDPERRERFCAEMSQALDLPVRPAGMPEDAARGQDIVVTITTAAEPVLRGEWLESGVHVNAAGSNSVLRRELDETAVRRASLVVVDSRAQARLECGDLVGPVERGVLDWEQLADLADVVAGRVGGRGGAEEITLFESQGLGLEDVTVAMRLYERARSQGIGEEVEMFADMGGGRGR